MSCESHETPYPGRSWNPPERATEVGRRKHGNQETERSVVGPRAVGAMSAANGNSAEDIGFATQRNGGLEDARLNFDTRSAPVVDEGLNLR